MAKREKTCAGEGVGGVGFASCRGMGSAVDRFMDRVDSAHHELVVESAQLASARETGVNLPDALVAVGKLCDLLVGCCGCDGIVIRSGVGGVSIHSTADRMVMLGSGFSLRGAVIAAMCRVPCDDGVKRAELDRCLSLLV